MGGQAMSDALDHIKQHLPQLLNFAQHAKNQADYERSRTQFIDTNIVTRETLLLVTCALVTAVIELDERLSRLETDGK